MSGKSKRVVQCPRVTLPDTTTFSIAPDTEGRARFIVDYYQVCSKRIPWVGKPPKKLTMNGQVYRVDPTMEPFKMPFDPTLCGGCPDPILEKIISHFIVTYRDNSGCVFTWSATDCENMIMISQACD
jgi:hypothetical protein